MPKLTKEIWNSILQPCQTGILSAMLAGSRKLEFSLPDELWEEINSFMTAANLENPAPTIIAAIRSHSLALNRAKVDMIKQNIIQNDFKFSAIVDSVLKDQHDNDIKLIEAVKNNDLELAELLLSIGANVNAQYEWGLPLNIAARNGHHEMVTLILKAGAIVDNIITGFLNVSIGLTALMEAASNDHVAIVQQLLNAGAVVDYESPYDGFTALSHASDYGRDKIVSLLLTMGADIDHKSKEGFTPLMLSLGQKNHKATITLVTEGASLKPQDAEGHSIFDMARSWAPMRVHLNFLLEEAAKRDELEEILEYVISLEISDIASETIFEIFNTEDNENVTDVLTLGVDTALDL